MTIQKQVYLTPEQVADYLIKNKASTFGNLASNFNVSTDFVHGFILGNPKFKYREETGFATLTGLGDKLCFGCGGENWFTYTSKILGRKYHDDCVEKLFLDRKPSESIKIKIPKIEEERKVECGICIFSSGERTENEYWEWCTRFFDRNGEFSLFYRPFYDSNEAKTLALEGFEQPACQFLEPWEKYEVPQEFLEQRKIAKRATIAFMNLYSLPREIIPEDIKSLMKQFSKDKTLPENDSEKIENFVKQDDVRRIERVLV